MTKKLRSIDSYTIYLIIYVLPPQPSMNKKKKKILETRRNEIIMTVRVDNRENVQNV